MVLNFKIVENTTNTRYDDELYHEFVRLYNDWSISVSTIREKLDLTSNQVSTLRKYALEDGLITIRRKGRNIKPKCDVKNYYYDHSCNRFCVGKVIDGTYYYFGQYKTRRMAEYIVKEMRKVDWDETEYPRIRSEMFEKILCK